MRSFEFFISLALLAERGKAAFVNVLTDNRPPFNPEIGSPNLRGISCKVYKETN